MEVYKELLDAVEYIKSRGFTYIKVELEGELHREERTIVDCDNCNRHGVIIINNETGLCRYCRGTGEIVSDTRWNLNQCQRFILDHIPQKARDLMVYNSFVNDGSVDSEFTFTIALDGVRYLPYFLNAFSMLAEKIGNGLDTDGAGMHIGLLNDPDGNYDSDGDHENHIDHVNISNMAAQMQKLMLAFFFLASGNHKTRPMHFRIPQVSSEKYSAINYGSDILEYRVFDTCYDHPEMIWEFVEVIARSLEYYDTDIKLPKRIMNCSYKFRAPNGNMLARLYDDERLIKLLDKQLPYLLPKGKTIAAVKKERGFRVDAERLKRKKLKREVEARMQLPEYRERMKSYIDKMVKEVKHHEDRAKMTHDRYLLEVIEQRKEHIANLRRTIPKTPRQFANSAIRRDSYEYEEEL